MRVYCGIEEARSRSKRFLHLCNKLNKIPKWFSLQSRQAARILFWQIWLETGDNILD
jgi:hypothetical protein